MDLLQTAAQQVFTIFSSYNMKRLYDHEEISLAYFLSARLRLQKMCSPQDLLEFHFQSSSTAATAESVSIAAATIANGGKCPLTGWPKIICLKLRFISPE